MGERRQRRDLQRGPGHEVPVAALLTHAGTGEALEVRGVEPISGKRALFKKIIGAVASGTLTGFDETMRAPVIPVDVKLNFTAEYSDAPLQQKVAMLLADAMRERAEILQQIPTLKNEFDQIAALFHAFNPSGAGLLMPQAVPETMQKILDAYDAFIHEASNAQDRCVQILTEAQRQEGIFSQANRDIKALQESILSESSNFTETALRRYGSDPRVGPTDYDKEVVGRKSDQATIAVSKALEAIAERTLTHGQALSAMKHLEDTLRGFERSDLKLLEQDLKSIKDFCEQQKQLIGNLVSKAKEHVREIGSTITGGAPADPDLDTLLGALSFQQLDRGAGEY